MVKKRRPPGAFFIGHLCEANSSTFSAAISPAGRSVCISLATLSKLSSCAAAPVTRNQQLLDLTGNRAGSDKNIEIFRNNRLVCDDIWKRRTPYLDPWRNKCPRQPVRLIGKDCGNTRQRQFQRNSSGCCKRSVGLGEGFQSLRFTHNDARLHCPACSQLPDKWLDLRQRRQNDVDAIAAVCQKIDGLAEWFRQD